MKIGGSIMKDYVLETNDLVKQYGRVKAVNRISMQVERGAIYGLIGKNGAGKTTFMKMITGLSDASEGGITLFSSRGKDVSKQQRRIGLLIESPGIHEGMTAFENLKLKAIGMGVYNKNTINDLLNLIGLEGTGKKKAKSFSLGMKQRLGLGLALIGSPDLLVLDEPINGLDPQGIIEFRMLMERLNRERKMTVIISSHILEELYKIVTHIGIIDKGSLVRQMTKEELDKQCAKKLVIGTPKIREATVALESLGIHKYAVVGDEMIHVFENLECIQAVTETFGNLGIPILEIYIQNENLEEYFIELTGKGGK